MKTFRLQIGDKWTRLEKALWLYRGEHAYIFLKDSDGLLDPPDKASYRNEAEVDLSTAEAVAQLREWGYEIEDGVAPEDSLMDRLCLWLSNHPIIFITLAISLVCLGPVLTHILKDLFK